jgi:hypothetical protein
MKVFNETGKAWDDKQIKAEIELLTSVQHEHLNRYSTALYSHTIRTVLTVYCAHY